MNCYLITYDLLSKEKDYAALYEQIKAYGSWWHYLQSVWILSTTYPLEMVSSGLRDKIEDTDNLFVVDITGRNRAGWLNKNAWQWLATNNPKV